jgi:hypothetical protein
MGTTRVQQRFCQMERVPMGADPRGCQRPRRAQLGQLAEDLEAMGTCVTRGKDMEVLVLKADGHGHARPQLKISSTESNRANRMSTRFGTPNSSFLF